MKIITTKNKKLAFERFLNQIKYGQIAGFEIPDSLISKAQKLKKVDDKKFSSEQKEIHLSIKKEFERLWKKHLNELNELPKRLKKYKKILFWLTKTTKEFTGINWPYKNLYIIPGIRSWGANKNNVICIGIRPDFLLPPDTHLISNTLMNLIIHELIHSNINGLKINKLTYPLDSEEIAVTLLVRKVARADNKKFSANVPDQKLSVPFKTLEEKYNEKLENLLKQSNSYRSLVLKIDKFLKSIKHREIYK